MITSYLVIVTGAVTSGTTAFQGVFWLAFGYFLLLAASLGTVRSDLFPWYLAGKAAQGSVRWRIYWYPRFVYHFQRALKEKLPKADGDLFVRLHTRRIATAAGKVLRGADAPSLRTLVRAFEQTNHRILVLASNKSKADGIASLLQQLRDRVKSSGTFGEAYFGFIMDLFQAFDDEDQKLLREFREETWWDRHPRAIKVTEVAVGYGVAVVVGIVTLRILGFELPI